MFYKKPKSDSPKDLYDWALEFTEMLNRDRDLKINSEKEVKTNVNKNTR